MSYLPLPHLPASRSPRDSRRWRRAAQRNRLADGLENRRFLWFLAATIIVVLAVVGALLAQSMRDDDKLADQIPPFE